MQLMVGVLGRELCDCVYFTGGSAFKQLAEWPTLRLASFWPCWLGSGPLTMLWLVSEGHKSSLSVVQKHVSSM